MFGSARGRAVWEAVLEECARHGIPKPTPIRTGKHIKAVLHIDGESRTLTLPVSPSCHDAAKTKLADLRRLIRSIREDAA